MMAGLARILPKYQVPIFSEGGDLTAPGTTRVRYSLNRTRDETGGAMNRDISE